MVASVPKQTETTTDSSVIDVETRTKPANNRLHVQVRVRGEFEWEGARGEC